MGLPGFAGHRRTSPVKPGNEGVLPNTAGRLPGISGGLIAGHCRDIAGTLPGHCRAFNCRALPMAIAGDLVHCDRQAVLAFLDRIPCADVGGGGALCASPNPFVMQ